MHFPDRRVEQAADGQGSVTDGLEGLAERGLVVQGFARVGDEHRRDAEGVLLDKNGRGRIPGRIAAGFEGGAQAAAGEGGSVRFLLDQGFPVEGFDHASLPVVFQQGVVLFRRQIVQGLEPVGDVGHPVLQGPGLHPVGDLVGRVHIQRFPVVNAVDQGIVGPDVQVFPHLVAVEGKLSEIGGRPLGGGFDFDGLFLEGVLDDVESQFAHNDDASFRILTTL